MSDQRSELVVLSSFIALYGVVELFLTMGFTDYNYVQNQLDQYKEPESQEEQMQDTWPVEQDARLVTFFSI